MVGVCVSWYEAGVYVYLVPCVLVVGVTEGLCVSMYVSDLTLEVSVVTPIVGGSVCESAELCLLMHVFACCMPDAFFVLSVASLEGLEKYCVRVPIEVNVRGLSERVRTLCVPSPPLSVSAIECVRGWVWFPSYASLGTLPASESERW